MVAEEVFGMRQKRLSKEELRNSVTGITNIKIESNLLQKIIIRIIEHFTP